MTFADEMAALAIEMLDEFGEDGTLIKSSSVTSKFNKRTGRAEANSLPHEIPVRVAPREIPTEGVDGRKTFQSAVYASAELQQNDKLVLANLTLTVGKVTTFRLQGQNVAFMAEVS